MPDNRSNGDETYGVPWDYDSEKAVPTNESFTSEPQGKPFDVKEAGRSTPPSGHPNKYGADRWAPKIT